MAARLGCRGAPVVVHLAREGEANGSLVTGQEGITIKEKRQVFVHGLIGGCAGGGEAALVMERFTGGIAVRRAKARCGPGLRSGYGRPETSRLATRQDSRRWLGDRARAHFAVATSGRAQKLLEVEQSRARSSVPAVKGAATGAPEICGVTRGRHPRGAACLLAGAGCHRRDWKATEASFDWTESRVEDTEKQNSLS